MPEEARVVAETCLVGRGAYLEEPYQVGASPPEEALKIQAVEVQVENRPHQAYRGRREGMEVAHLGMPL
jgi:hypothetical protein